MRILVLELDAGWPQRIALGRLRHAGAGDVLRRLLNLVLELRPTIGLGAVAAAGDDKRERAIRIVHAEMERRKAAHRQANDMRLADPERVEHRSDVVTRVVLRVSLA